MVAERTASGDVADLRRRAGRRSHRPAAPDPLHRPQLQRPRRRDRPGRAGRADPLHQVAQHHRRAVRRRADPARLDQDRLGGRARHRDRPADLLPRLGRGGPRRDRRLRAGQRRQRARLPDRAQRPVVEGQVGRDVQPDRARGWSRPTRSTTCWRWACGSTSTGSSRQRGSTATMVFDPYFIVHHLSQFMVLEPGDLIDTGTPPGVGMGLDPQVWLAPGDVMELGIDGLGTPAADRDRRRADVRAFVLTGPGESSVQDVEPPVAGPGEVVVDIDRVGVCGTDMEIFSGQMEYLHDGLAHYPLRLGHEWCGTVSAVGPGVDESWLGRRTTGDTQIGCGHCHRCRTGRQHVCDDRYEIGLRRGFPGALAEQLAVPVTALLPLPDSRRRRGRRDGRAGRQRAPRRPRGAGRAGRAAAGPRARARSGCWRPRFALAAGLRGARGRGDGAVPGVRRDARRRRRLDRPTTCPTSAGTASSTRPTTRRRRPAPPSSSTPAAGSSTSGSPRRRACSTPARS